MAGLRVIECAQEAQYNAVLELQHALLEEKAVDRSRPEVLVLAEHSPMYTIGRAAKGSRPAAPFDRLPCIEVSRGGAMTYHGPGQLIAYPVFDLRLCGSDVHMFLRRLEETGIKFLAKLGLRGARREGLTGVWLPAAAGNGKGEKSWRKIASIGIAVRRGVSYHGIAINISPDLAAFRAIAPCGQEGRLMTSLSEQGVTVAGAEAKEIFIRSIAEVFGLTLLVWTKQGASRTVQTPLPEPPPADSAHSAKPVLSRPAWLRAKAPGSPEYLHTQELVRGLKLHTVCEEAKCPNIGECWSHRTATFMIMGDQCTRRCRFCAVEDGHPQALKPLDPLEPLRVAEAISRLALRHAVITCVNRDDLPDMGSAHFVSTAEQVALRAPDCDLEFLISDLRGRRELLEVILRSPQLKVLNHNVETVPRLYRTVRPGAQFSRSLAVLRWAGEIAPAVKRKSGLMVGLGETHEEVQEVMERLREADVQILTIGQYLQPTAKQLPVQRFVEPHEFEQYRRFGQNLGFSHVESGPLVRSSYHAWRHVAPKAAAAQSAGSW